ncbi:hypothetical protein ACFQZ1_21410 [Bacillus sp. CGMCC 1.60114]|uniref:hypothetical protein n=1 Tax=unclassified Bacillus (in: firmicutes) TaxID=185979 RepID=UPI00362EA05B
MKKISKLALTPWFTGALTLSINFENAKVFAANEQFEIKQTPSENINGDRYLVVTREQQEAIENSQIKEGFLETKEGTKIFFKKNK